MNTFNRTTSGPFNTSYTLSRSPVMASNATFNATSDVQGSPLGGTFDLGRSASPAYSDTSYSARSSDISNTTWANLEQSVIATLGPELQILDQYSPEQQMTVLRSFFEDNFVLCAMFEQFLSAIKCIICEHSSDMSISRDYAPGSILANLKRCLNIYKDGVKATERKLMEIDSQVQEKLKMDDRLMEQTKKSIKDIVLGYQTRLKAVNERAATYAQQRDDLQMRLSEATERLQQVEWRQNLSNSMTRPSNRSTFSDRDSDARSMAGTSSDAINNSLMSQLAKERETNERLRMSLRQSSGRSAMLEEKLSSALEESLHKSNVLSALSNEVIDSLEKNAATYLSNASSGNQSQMLGAWQSQLKDAIDYKEAQMQKLDKLLYETELKVVDVQTRLTEKQNKILALQEQLDTVANKIARAEAEMEIREIRIGRLTEQANKQKFEIADLERVIDVNEMYLARLKQDFAGMRNEMESIQKFRSRLSVDLGKSIDDPQNYSDFAGGIKSFAISDAGSALRSFAGIASTPFKAAVAPREYKGTLLLRSPRVNDPLMLNFSLSPSMSGEHLKCGMVEKDSNDLAPAALPAVPQPLSIGYVPSASNRYQRASPKRLAFDTTIGGTSPIQNRTQDYAVDQQDGTSGMATTSGQQRPLTGSGGQNLFRGTLANDSSGFLGKYDYIPGSK